MFQNDYVLRMIEMMGTLLRRIRDLLDEKEKNLLLDEACKTHCGMNFDSMSALSSDTLCRLLPENARLFASELFYIKSEAFTGREEEFRLKSLRLLLSLQKEGSLCEARRDRADELRQKLEAVLGCEDELQCAAFFLEGNAFDRCEDAVFRALSLASTEEKADCYRRGLALLQTASEADQTDLALCNSSREELLEAVRDFHDEYSKSTAGDKSV